MHEREKSCCLFRHAVISNHPFSHAQSYKIIVVYRVVLNGFCLIAVDGKMMEKQQSHCQYHGWYPCCVTNCSNILLVMLAVMLFAASNFFWAIH